MFNDRIVASNMNDLAIKTFDKIIESGSSIFSRNGETRELVNQDIFLTNPRNRHLYLKGRTSNIYATIAETFWVLSGESSLDPLMNLVLPRAKEYSDDGINWRGNYGERIFKNDQIDHVIEMFARGGVNSRQATMSIWRPDLDTISAIRSQGYESTKDMPCSQHLSFFIRNNKLNLKFLIRSNDGIYGMTGINIFEFSVLQELILELLKSQGGEFVDLDLGYYNHSVISLHLYNETIDQAKKVLQLPQQLISKPIFSIKFPNMSYVLFKKFFYDLYHYYFVQLSLQAKSVEVDEIFSKYNIPTERNQLYSYAIIVENYLRYKKHISSEERITKMKANLSEDMLACIKHNNFTPASWLIKGE